MYITSFKGDFFNCTVSANVFENYHNLVLHQSGELHVNIHYATVGAKTVLPVQVEDDIMQELNSI